MVQEPSCLFINYLLLLQKDKPKVVADVLLNIFTRHVRNKKMHATKKCTSATLNSDRVHKHERSGSFLLCFSLVSTLFYSKTFHKLSRTLTLQKDFNYKTGISKTCYFLNTSATRWFLRPGLQTKHGNWMRFSGFVLHILCFKNKWLYLCILSNFKNLALKVCEMHLRNYGIAL